MAKGGTRYDKVTREEIVRKYLDGYKLTLIAQQYGCDISYPTTLAKRAGHTRRRGLPPRRRATA